MNWLTSLSRSISARIEGRNTLIGLILAFCAFAIYVFVSTYDHHPLLSAIFSSIIFLIVIAMAGIALLKSPQPSEVSQKSIVIKRDFFWAGGMQSHEEVVSVLREAHCIRDLPRPYGIVKGSATNPADYHALDPDEAAKLAHEDHDGVEKMLLAEAARISTSIIGGQLREPLETAGGSITAGKPPESKNQEPS